MPPAPRAPPSRSTKVTWAGWHRPQEVALIEIRLALARELRRRRARRRLTQVQMAKLLRSSQSRVAKMEAADRSVSVDLLVRALLALGATRVELGRLLARRAA